jgi:ADP-ribose pyrophosphatase
MPNTRAKTPDGPSTRPTPATNGRQKKYPKGVEVLSTQRRYQGPVFSVDTDEVREPGGHVGQRDVVRHPGSAVIVAVDTNGGRRDPLILVERQYRHAAGQYMLELPAGSLDPGEDPLQGAKRELREETGYTARRWRKLVRLFASPGFLGEWMQIFVAEELKSGAAQPEDDERIELKAVPLSELLQAIEAGKIQDGKTIAGLLLYDRVRRLQTRAAGESRGARK